MSDCIDRELLKSKIRAAFPSLEDRCRINEIVNSIPTADVKPVVRGKWIKSRKHIWEKNEDGTVNEFAWGRGIHNGPFCTICGETPCVHCEPDYDEKDCEKEHYICPFCGRIEMNFQPFCNCGVDMRETEK